MVERLDIYLQVSEKEAIAAFPLMDGTFDHLGFIARDRRSHKWCKDLFQYYWERSPTRASVAEEMYGWLKKRPKAIHAFKNIAAGEEIEGGEELISELENVSLVSQGKLTFIGELISRGFCIYCSTPSRGDAFCRSCGRKVPEI